MKNYILNFIGFASSISFVFILFFLVPDVLRGDFSKIHAFFETYQGSEPFVIMTLPIILIAGPVWLWRMGQSLTGKGKNDGKK